jgi:hypothetical protein
MLKALVIKELRESAGIVVLALLGIVYAISGLTGMRLLPWQGSSTYMYPFIYDSLSYYLALCIGGMAVALGFKQTAWEVGQGTHFFLLHRPVSRDRVFACKLLVGLALVIALSAAFILIYAWWMATPGSIPAPFDWSMTIPAWQKWVALPVVYLGAFLSGIRPGRWYGSRTLPLVAAIFVATLAGNVPIFWLGLLISGVACGAFLISIFYYVRRRDY